MKEEKEEPSLLQNFTDEINSIEKEMACILYDYISSGYESNLARVYLYLKKFDLQKAEDALSKLNPELKKSVIAAAEKIEEESKENSSEMFSKTLSDVAHIFDISDFNSRKNFERMHKLAQDLRESELNEVYTPLGEKNPLLQMLIEEALVTFSDILDFDDRAIQRILRETGSQDLAAALIDQNDELKNKIFRNMSRRATVMLKEDIEYMERRFGKDKTKKVEEARLKICHIIRRLENNGEIVIRV